MNWLDEEPNKNHPLNIKPPPSIPDNEGLFYLEN